MSENTETSVKEKWTALATPMEEIFDKVKATFKKENVRLSVIETVMAVALSRAVKAAFAAGYNDNNCDAFAAYVTGYLSAVPALPKHTEEK